MKPIELKDHAIVIDEERGAIEICAPSGPCLLEVTITPEGPRVRLSGAQIEIAAPERLTLATKHFELKAERADIDVAGELRERIGGDAIRTTKGTAALIGRDVRLKAPTGEVTIDANDDVDVRGERVRLNCEDPPMPQSWEEHDRRG